MIIGYTTGVFDLFHIGHLNIIKQAKKKCDYLIVGVTTDELCLKLKNRKPIIPLKERVEIIRNIRDVDQVVEQHEIDELADHDRLHFDIIFKGSDWQNTNKWKVLDKKFAEKNVKVIFFPYTQSTSSTIIRKVLQKMMSD